MIPVELTKIDQWITWEPRGTDKKPLNSRGQVASALDPTNWQSYVSASLGSQPKCCDLPLEHDSTFKEHHLMQHMLHLLCSKCRQGTHKPIKSTNIGFVLTGDYVVIDGDHEPWISLLTERFIDLTYCESSPHGGIHVWLRGAHANKRGNFEIYGSRRWMTMTGQGNDLPIVDIDQDTINWLKENISVAKPN